MKRRKQWIYSPKKAPQPKLSAQERTAIRDRLQPLIEHFKKEYILEKPDKTSNYLVDVYIKWFRNHLYLCEKFASENPNRIADTFEMKFVRLTYTGEKRFTLSFLHHTERWASVAESLTLDECKEMIVAIPTFHPIS